MQLSSTLYMSLDLSKLFHDEMRQDEMRDEIVILLAPCKYNILLNLLFHEVMR